MTAPSHQRLSPEALELFIDVLKRTGNASLASRAVGISTTTAHQWKNRSARNPKDERYLMRDPMGEDPDTTFAEAWAAAQQESITLVHDQAMTLATGFEEPVIHQGKVAYKPDYTSDYKIDPLTGMAYWPPMLDPLTGQPVPLTVRKVDSRAVFEILKARDPNYRPKQEVDVTSGGKPLAVPDRTGVTVEAFLARFGRKVEDE